MYYVSLNPALRNLDLPSSSAQGARLSNPPLALDLHYLVTAYGSTQFDPEILLAWALSVFHEMPVIASQTIQAALDALGGQPGASTEASLISQGTLADQVEHIRITPEALTAQEIWQLWTAFQAAYRPTAALQVSVVVIQDTQPFTSNRPVQHRVVTALPMQTPVITGLSPLMIPAGQVLSITGNNFLGGSPADTVVSFDSGRRRSGRYGAGQSGPGHAARHADGRHAHRTGPADGHLPPVERAAPGLQLQPGAVPADPGDPGPGAPGHRRLTAHPHAHAGRRAGRSR